MTDERDAWDITFAWLAKHGALPALGVLTVGVGIMFGHVFGGEVIGDDNSFHLAESARIADCIRVGDWDFWNPSANAGYASAYYYQVLPQLVSAVPAALFGHHLFWFQLSIWLPLVLIPAAAYRGARLLGAAPWPAIAAAVAVAFISGASRWGTGADGTFQVGLYTQTWALALFPLALGHGVRSLLHGESLVPAVAWGTFVFLCHPFAGISLDLALAVGVFAYWFRAPIRSDLWRVGVLALCALVVAGSGLLVVVSLFGETTKVIYLAPLVLAAVLLARVADHGRYLRLTLLAIAAVAFAINAYLFATERTPKTDKDPGGDLLVLYIGPLVLLAVVIGRLLWELGVFARGERRPLAQLVRAPPPEPEPGPANARTFVRLCILGALLFVASIPGWLTLVVDRDGFGGFPHRVADEVGPGYSELMSWFTKGGLLDFARPMVLTWLVPVVLLFGRGGRLRWLSTPALAFAALLALGPHLPKTGDDLLPAVRFLGALQIVLAMLAGLGAYAIGQWLWDTAEDTPRIRIARIVVLALVAAAGATFLGYLWISEDGGWAASLLHRLLLRTVEDIDLLRVIGTAAILLAVPLTAFYSWQSLLTQFGLRTAIASIAAIVTILVVVPGGRALAGRVFVLGDYKYKDELHTLNRELAKQPPGRKQVGPGAESHYWNLLSYEYGRRESLLQMGGGGLQASPNYDFLWSVREFPKLAWVYATPYFVFERSKEDVPAGETVFQTASYELRRLRAPQLVSPVQVTGVLPAGRSRAGSEVRNAALNWLRSDVAMKDHVLAYDGQGGPGAPPQATVRRAFRQDSPGDQADIIAEVDVSAPSTFVARESWHPRWHAYVDGVEVPVRRVTPDFPAIDVGAGTHVLAFRFERPWWAHVAWLAWPGAVLAAWLLQRRSRRQDLVRGDSAEALRGGAAGDV